MTGDIIIPTIMEVFLLDLRGYIVIKGALSLGQVRCVDERADELLAAEPNSAA